jgi:hypothetical protein
LQLLGVFGLVLHGSHLVGVALGLRWKFNGTCVVIPVLHRYAVLNAHTSSWFGLKEADGSTGAFPMMACVITPVRLAQYLSLENDGSSNPKF